MVRKPWCSSRLPSAQPSAPITSYPCIFAYLPRHREARLGTRHTLLFLGCPEVEVHPSPCRKKKEPTSPARGPPCPRGHSSPGGVVIHEIHTKKVYMLEKGGRPRGPWTSKVLTRGHHDFPVLPCYPRDQATHITTTTTTEWARQVLRGKEDKEVHKE